MDILFKNDDFVFSANDRENPEAASGDNGIGSAARARKLSAIKAFYNYLTVSTKQITDSSRVSEKCQGH